MFLSNNKWIDSGIVGYSVSVILHWIWLFYKSMNDILTAIVNTSKKKKGSESDIFKWILPVEVFTPTSLW